jgi:hypothetical protein
LSALINLDTVGGMERSMNAGKQLVACWAAVWLMASVSTFAVAQGPPTPGAQAATAPAVPGGARGAGPGPAAAAPFGPGGGPRRGAPVPEPVPPAKNFATSTEHYQYLLNLHKGGTRHTYESVPKWEGLWSPAGDTSSRLFRLGGNMNTGGEIVTGVLTPAYEAAFKQRRALGADYDRLTSCEPAGYPRWLLEPYVREFVNTPSQSWWVNDLGNDMRRVFINQEHKNTDGTHSPEGDSIGFWTADTLVVHTVDIYPNDYFRGLPPTSNQFESVEEWRLQPPSANGARQLVVNVTFYDKVSLLRPVTAVYTFRRNSALETSGYRMRHWECDSNSNTFLVTDDKGNPSTQFRLPGEVDFDDVRGVDPKRNPDLPRDLPGQEKNPTVDEAPTAK